MAHKLRNPISVTGVKREPASYAGATALATVIREHYSDTSTLPVIASYPVSRVVNRITPDVPKQPISAFDIYENALGEKSNFNTFFEWFRNQDDILNEKAMARARWMKQNKKWILQRIDTIFQRMNDFFDSFEKSISEDETHDKDEFIRILKMAQDTVQIIKDSILVEPYLLLIYFSNVMHTFEMISSAQNRAIFHDIESMFRTMAILSRNSQDDLIEANKPFFQLIEKITESFKENRFYEEVGSLLHLIWEIFSFAILLSFWWMSYDGRGKVEMLLRQNINSLKELNTEYFDKFTAQLRTIVQEDITSEQHTKKSEGKELHFVRQAIETFIPEYTNLQVKRIPRPRMEVTKTGEIFDMNQLSDGEKNLIAVIGDIARRLAMANPTMENPLAGAGVILIDEIDLHLHPKWQRIIAQKLTAIFPNCQFFITTHSPQVISHFKPESVFALQNTEGTITQHAVSDSYGKNSDRILEDIMDETARPKKIDKEIKDIFKLIQEGEVAKAQKKITTLRNDIGEDGELIKADVLITRREIIGK